MTPLVLLLFLAGPPATTGLDAFGKRLPPGAVARFGGLRVHRLAFSPDGRLLAVGYAAGVVELWDLSGPRRLRTLFGHAAGVASLGFSSDGKRLATGEGLDGDADKAVRARVWDVASGKKLIDVEVGKKVVRTAGLLLGGKVLLTYTPYGVLRWWDVTSGKRLSESDWLGGPSLFRPEAGAEAYLWRRDGTLLSISLTAKETVEVVAGGGDRSDTLAAVLLPGAKEAIMQDGNVLRWHALPSGRKSREVTLPDAWKNPNVAAFAPAGDALAWATDRVTLLSPLEATAPRATLADGGPINAVAFSPDGRLLASAGPNGVVLWDVGRATFAATFDAWLADGSREAAVLARRVEAGHLLSRRLLTRARAEQTALRLLGRLSGDSFDDRESATRELTLLLPEGRPALIRAIDGGLPAEAKRRVQRVLGAVEKGEEDAALDEKSPARLAAMLRRVGTPDTLAALRSLARMNADVPLAAEARKLVGGVP